MATSIITCIQCEADFEFTAEERQRYARQGFDEPKRCPSCRKHRLRLRSPESETRNYRRESMRPHHNRRSRSSMQEIGG